MTTIRRMKIEDSEKVAELSNQLGYPNTGNDIRTRFVEVARLETHALLVAVSQVGEGCGFIQINVESPNLFSGHRAEIAALVVEEKCRGTGVGKHLMAAAEAWAKAKSISLVRLTSNIRREDAHRFYQRRGYEILKTWHLFTKTLAAASKAPETAALASKDRDEP